MISLPIYLIAQLKSIGNIFDYPYIVINDYKVTPAMILLILYMILLLVASFVIKRGENGFTLRFFTWDKYTRGRKNHIKFSLFVFCVICIVCLCAKYFFSEITLIQNVLSNYLICEPIIAVIIICFLCSTFLTSNNKSKHIEASNRILSFFIPVSVGCGLISGIIDLTYWCNWVVVILTFVIYFMLLVSDFVKVEQKVKKEKNGFILSFNPIEKFDQLFPQYKYQAERIVDIIDHSSSEPISICLSGEWGTGKTSIINGVEDLLTNRKCNLNTEYEFIRINSMELDNKNALLNYFMNEVKSCLLKKGVYVGVASEYTEFLSSMAGTVITNSFGTILRNKVFGEDKDYSKQKKKLEELLESTFSDGKLILVIDDIERCEPKIARDYLFLIKEVATMKNCVSIFLTDFNILVDLLNKDTDVKFDKMFLDKFFNYRIDLHDIEVDDILLSNDRIFCKESIVYNILDDKIKLKPGKWCIDALDGISALICKLVTIKNEQLLKNRELTLITMDDRVEIINKLKVLKSRLMDYVTNSRKIVRFYNFYNENIEYCYRGIEKLEGKMLDEVISFVHRTRISQVIALISFIQSFMPEELKKIERFGRPYMLQSYDNIYVKKANFDLNDQHFINLLAYTTILKNDSNKNIMNLDDYIQISEGVERFLNCYFELNLNWEYILNPYSSNEKILIDIQKWSNGKKGVFADKLTQSNWGKYVSIVLESYCDKEIQVLDTGKDYIDYLLHTAFENVKIGEWSIESIFSIFRGEYIFALCKSQKKFMKRLYDYLEKVDIFEGVSKEIMDNLFNFSDSYISGKFFDLLRFFEIIPFCDKSKDIFYFLDKIDEKIDGEYILDICEDLHHTILGKKSNQKSWISILKEILKYVGKLLSDNDYMKYKDINDLFAKAESDIEDLKYFMKIYHLVVDKFLIDMSVNLSNTEILDKIDYFEREFENNKYKIDGKMRIQFENYLMTLNKNANDILQIKHIDRLNELISIISSVHYRGVSDLRKITLELKMKIENKTNTISDYTEK